MRVLLDENIPVELAAALAPHSVATVVGLGWTGITNGELLRRAAGQYDALVTMDKNLEHQQSVPTLSFGVVLLRAPSNRMRYLRPLLPRLLTALEAVKAGALLQVGA